MESKTISTNLACSEHKSEEVRFYCNDCNAMICDDCVVGGHSSHKKTKLKEYCDAVILSVTEANKRVPKIRKDIELAVNAKNIFNESIDRDIVEIRQKRELIRQVLNELHDDLIKNLEDARKAGNEKFDQFTRSLTRRCDSFKHIMEVIQSKGPNITQTEISICKSEFEQVMNSYPFSENVPNIEPPRYRFTEDYISKENLKHVMGQLCLEDNQSSDINPKLKVTENVHEVEKGSDFCEEYTPSNKIETAKNYIIMTSFRYPKKVTHIVPSQSCKYAWLIGKEISEINFNTDTPKITPVTELYGTPITAARSHKYGLLIGLFGKKYIKQLQVSSGTFRKHMYKLVSHLNIQLDSVLAMCTSSPPRDVTLCIKCNRRTGSNSENFFEIHWYSDLKQKVAVVSISSNDVEIDTPIHICEDINGDLCITCSPVGSVSWVVLLDKNGNQKMRYPPKESKDANKTMLYSFLGSGFLRDGTITVLDRVKFCQHLIDRTGRVLQIDSYDSEPRCLAVDNYDNIWVGFEDGTIQIMNYNNRYETVNTNS